MKKAEDNPWSLITTTHVMLFAFDEITLVVALYVSLLCAYKDQVFTCGS